MVSNGPKFLLGFCFVFGVFCGRFLLLLLFGGFCCFFSNFFIQDTGQEKKIGCRSQEKTYKHVGIQAELTANATGIWKLIKRVNKLPFLLTKLQLQRAHYPYPLQEKSRHQFCGISIILVTCCRQLSRDMFYILTAAQ